MVLGEKQLGNVAVIEYFIFGGVGGKSVLVFLKDALAAANRKEAVSLVVGLFDMSKLSDYIKIGDKIFREVSGGNERATEVFSGATDKEVFDFAKLLAGKDLTPAPGAAGRYFAKLPDGAIINLRSVSSSAEKRGPSGLLILIVMIY